MLSNHTSHESHTIGRGISQFFPRQSHTGIGIERLSVGMHTLNESNSRGDLVEAVADATEVCGTQHDVQQKT